MYNSLISTFMTLRNFSFSCQLISTDRNVKYLIFKTARSPLASSEGLDSLDSGATEAACKLLAKVSKDERNNKNLKGGGSFILIATLDAKVPR